MLLYNSSQILFISLAYNLISFVPCTLSLSILSLYSLYTTSFITFNHLDCYIPPLFYNFPSSLIRLSSPHPFFFHRPTLTHPFPTHPRSYPPTPYLSPFPFYFLSLPPLSSPSVLPSSLILHMLSLIKYVVLHFHF